MRNIITILGFILLPFASCQYAGKVQNALQIADSLINIISTFAKDNFHFSSLINDVVETTTEGINSKKKTSKIANFWEKYWDKINSRYNDLEAKYMELQEKATEYFGTLNQNNSEIRDSSLRAQDKARNDTLKSKWHIENDRARENLSMARAILLRGNDYAIMLKNSAMRETISNSISDLQVISVEAQDLAERIKLFEKNAISIFKNEK